MTRAERTAAVLLVSDDPTTRESVITILAGAGYAVTQADPEAAGAGALEAPADVIVLDVSEPAAADEVARELKADGVAPLVPLLRLTIGKRAPPRFPTWTRRPTPI